MSWYTMVLSKWKAYNNLLIINANSKNFICCICYFVKYFQFIFVFVLHVGTSPSQLPSCWCGVCVALDINRRGRVLLRRSINRDGRCARDAPQESSRARLAADAVTDPARKTWLCAIFFDAQERCICRDIRLSNILARMRHQDGRVPRRTVVHPSPRFTVDDGGCNEIKIWVLRNGE